MESARGTMMAKGCAADVNMVTVPGQMRAESD